MLMVSLEVVLLSFDGGMNELFTMDFVFTNITTTITPQF